MPPAVQVYGGIILAEVIFGIWPVVASMAIKEGFDPIAFIFYRCAGSAVLLSIASWLIEGQLPLSLILPYGKSLEAARQFPWRDFLILGALTCSNMLGYIIGVALTSSTQAALMQPVIPVICCLAGLVSGTESISSGKLIGIMISVLGAMYVVYAGQEEAEDKSKRAGHRYQLGALALVVNVTSCAFYFVLQKKVLVRYKPILVASVTMIISSCFLAVIAFAYAEEFQFSIAKWILTPRREAVLAYAIIFTTTINWCVLAWANKVTTPTTITAFSTLQPLITAATGVFFLGIALHSYTIWGGAAILGGLLLTVRAQVCDAPPTRTSESAHLI